MLSKIYENELGFTAEFKFTYDISTGKLWNALVNNENFKFWMDHLEITDLCKGGNINFHYNDGSGKVEKLMITDYVDGKVLQFDWGMDTVRFEISAHSSTGSQLLLTEFLKEITDHTPKDLAGWHVCLLRFQDFMKSENHVKSEEEWEKWYCEYKVLVQRLIRG